MATGYGVSPDWAANTSNGREHIATKGIIQDQIVVNLDAGALSSYTGTGTTWSDLSGNGNNGAMFNTPGYNSDNGGSITLNGTDEYIVISTVPGTGNSTQSVTWGVWVYPTQTAGNIMSMSSVDPQGNWNMPPISAVSQKFTGRIWQNSRLESSTFTLNTWYYVVLVWKYSATSAERGQFFYVNGELEGSQTNITYSSSNTNNSLFLGQQNPGADNAGYFGGRYGCFHVYNKALSQYEVRKNFNSLRTRYGV